MITTGEDLRQARRRMGLSLGELADMLRLSGGNGARTLRDVEDGHRRLTGPVAVAVEAIEAGFRP